jgi:hypothetical protein
MHITGSSFALNYQAVTNKPRVMLWEQAGSLGGIYYENKLAKTDIFLLSKGSHTLQWHYCSCDAE